jgi:HEAT repeat protein
MTPRPYPLTFDPRLRTLEGKLELLAQLRSERPEKSVPLLLELLCDQSWHVRERATEALVERGDDVIGPLASLLDEGLWFTRACAAQALGQIGAPPSLPVLVAHLDEENATVRKAVAGALGAMVRRHGSGPVLAALADAGIDPERASRARVGEWSALLDAIAEHRSPKVEPAAEAGEETPPAGG